MANPETKIQKMWSRNGKDSVDVLYKLNDDGLTYSLSVVSSGEEGGVGLTDEELRATALPVSGPLTDTQVRATPLPVSGNIGLLPDLAVGAKSITLTLSTGVGQVPIPNTCHIVGVRPVSSTTIRVGLEAPEADGTATDLAVAGDLKKGFGVDAAVFTYFNVGLGVSRVLYLKGGASDVCEVAVM